MRITRLLLYIVVSVLLVAVPASSIAEDKPPADPRESVDTLIDHAIKLLEEKEFVQVLKLNDPITVKNLESKRGLAKEAEAVFDKDTVEVFLEMLKGLKNEKRKVSADGVRVIFKSGITLVKSGQLWCFYCQQDPEDDLPEVR